MAVREDKQRIMVTVSEDMRKRLDKYAEMLGINRSALCAFLLGQGVLSMDKAYGLIDQTVKQWRMDNDAEPFPVGQIGVSDGE